jgi:hypothetical protein
LNEARNRIIRLSLNIEMCMLGLTFGACFGSIFGMNLKSGLEDNDSAFSVVFFSYLLLSASLTCLPAYWQHGCICPSVSLSSWLSVCMANDNQHNNIQHNDIQHADIQYDDIQHYDIQHDNK